MGLIARVFTEHYGSSMLIGIGLTLFCMDCVRWMMYHGESFVLFNRLIRLDDMAMLSQLLSDIIGVYTGWLLSRDEGVRLNGIRLEYVLGVLVMLLGLHILVMAIHFGSMYVAMELVSIPSYVLVSMSFSKKSALASFQYMLWGAVASGVMLFGMSWIYGWTGSMNFSTVSVVSTAGLVPFLTIGAVFLLAGIFFKLAFFPFHRWVSSVYSSASLSLLPLLAVGSKLAVVVVLSRLLFSGVYWKLIDWKMLLGIIAMISMSVGNLAALRQSSVRKMIGYSSIAHAGFLLLGIISDTQIGMYALLFYGVVYCLMTIALLFFIQIFGLDNQDHMEAYKGLGISYPWLSVSFVIVLVSLIGLPPTIGFAAKFFIFSALWSSYYDYHHPVLMVAFGVGLANMILSAFYYLRIPYYLFLHKRSNVISSVFTCKQQVTSILFAVLLIILFFMSGQIMAWIHMIRFYF